MKSLLFAISFAACVLTTHAGGPLIVESSALGRTVTVRGTLGQPLGNLITIEGSAVEHDYPRTKTQDYNHEVLMRVTKVEGVKLQNTVVIQLHISRSQLGEFAPGVTRTFRGYEDGGFTGIPNEANRVLKAQSTDWYFKTFFRVVK